MSSDSPAKDLDAVTQRINSMMSKNGAENGTAADKVEEKDDKEKAGSELDVVGRRRLPALVRMCRRKER